MSTTESKDVDATSWQSFSSAVARRGSVRVVGILFRNQRGHTSVARTMRDCTAHVTTNLRGIRWVASCLALALFLLSCAGGQTRDNEPVNLALNKLARAHSENMAKQQKQDHTLDDKTPFDRLRAAGYKYLKAGENIGSADGGTLEMVMKAWMDSKGHAANILNPDYIEIGVGIAKCKDGTTYYTQLFTKPRK